MLTPGFLLLSYQAESLDVPLVLASECVIQEGSTGKRGHCLYDGSPSKRRCCAATLHVLGRLKSVRLFKLKYGGRVIRRGSSTGPPTVSGRDSESDLLQAEKVMKGVVKVTSDAVPRTPGPPQLPTV